MVHRTTSCHHCGSELHPGSRAIKVTQRRDGKFTRWNVCLACLDFRDAVQSLNLFEPWKPLRECAEGSEDDVGAWLIAHRNWRECSFYGERKAVPPPSKRPVIPKPAFLVGVG